MRSEKVDFSYNLTDILKSQIARSDLLVLSPRFVGANKTVANIL